MGVSAAKVSKVPASGKERSANVVIWMSISLASVILMITMGVRQTVGLFVHPIMESTTMNIAQISMAFAIGQLLWGLAQPFFGAWADKRGALPALVVGAVLIAAGQLGTFWASGPWSLVLTQGLLSPAGTAVGSFALLIAVVNGRLHASQRSFASGVVNAGGSLGQFIFAPLVQLALHMRGLFGGLASLGLLGLLTIIPAWFLCKFKLPKPVAALPAEPLILERPGLKEQLKTAFANKSFLLLSAGFFTCGFHVAFLVTHLPGEISSCGHTAAVSAASLSLIGLCNIAGSLASGYLGKYFRMKYILAALYASRALMIAIYLASPKTETTFYVFAAAIGLTWLGTVPPTAGIVGKLFGLRYFATLLGITMFAHQVGGFLGAFLGGVFMQYSGSYLWVWYIDIVLALLAALANLPIAEEKVGKAP